MLSISCAYVRRIEMNAEELYSNIKPVLRFADNGYKGQTCLERNDKGNLYYIKNSEVRKKDFIWNSKPSKKAEGLVEIANLLTTHETKGGFARPSIADILEQIPLELQDQIVAFETSTTHPKTLGNWNTAVTKLYRREENERNN